MHIWVFYDNKVLKKILYMEKDKMLTHENLHKMVVSHNKNQLTEKILDSYPTLQTPNDNRQGGESYQ